MADMETTRSTADVCTAEITSPAAFARRYPDSDRAQTLAEAVFLGENAPARNFSVMP